MRSDTFSKTHPIILFLYFSFVIIFSMFFMHPVCLSLSFVIALGYSVYLNGKKSWRFVCFVLIPMMLISALINPLFNHEGLTILYYFKNGNALTLESIIYGLMSALMIGSVILWFSCSNVVITSDKIMFLFGKIAPSLALMFSMVLRFVPKLKTQMKIITQAQKCLDSNINNKSILSKIKLGIKILSILVTWSLENAVETADSMKNRGYGAKKRTTFSNFRFDSRDENLLILMIALIIYILFGIFKGELYFRYFPSFMQLKISLYNLSLYVTYLLFLGVPLIMNLWEERNWKLIYSKM